MYLADTSVWTDHIRNHDPAMAAALAGDAVFIHACVVGELAVGNLRDRATFLKRLQAMNRVHHATDEEVLDMIEHHALSGTGISWVDAHLLASALITPRVTLWTRDRRLNEAAARLGCAAQVHH